jgi:hypothetical protein
MAQNPVSLTKGSGSRHRLRLALATIDSNFTDLYERIDEVEGGSGGGDWWPEGSKAFINFAETNRGAWTEDDGEVALSAVVGNDPDADASGFGEITAYTPANLTTDGLIVAGSMAFIGTVKDYLLAGSTVVFKIKDMKDGESSYLLALVDAAGETAVQLTARTSAEQDVRVRSFGNADPADVNGALLDGPSSENAIAATITPTRGELAVNNSSPASTVFDTTDWPLIGATPTAAMYHNESEDDVFVSLAIYDALPSTVGLQALANF